MTVTQGTPDIVAYTPDANYCGADEFAYTVTGGDSATVTITVTCLDDAPTAIDDTRTVAEDSGATTFNVLANDTDIDAGALEITGATDPDHGTVVRRPGHPRRDLLRARRELLRRPTSFSYTVNGGDTATVSITVTCIDDTPTAVDDTPHRRRGLRRHVVQRPRQRHRHRRRRTGDHRRDRPPTTARVSVVQGTPDVDLLRARRELLRRPTSFGYTVTGGDTATVSITVTCIDDTPTAVDDTRTVAEDSGATSINVLANDTDIDAGALEITGATAADHGTATVLQGTPDLVSYTPDANYCGTDEFSYTVNGGGTATVSITVTCTDDTPTAINDTRTVSEDSGATSFNVLANDSDIDAGPLEITDMTDPDHGTVTVTQGTPDTVAYTPDPNYCGTDDFAYTITGDDTATVTVTVTCIDDAPTAVDDTRTVSEDAGATTFNVLANDTDPDAGALEITGASAADHGTVSVVQGSPDAVSYAPDANYCGTDDFSYTVNGGDTATVTITVTCTDDAPTAIDDTRTVSEDSGATTFNVLANDTDPDAGALEITGASAADHGTVSVVQGSPDAVSYAPDANYCGTDDFSYTVNGGDTATVTITVTCTDDAPTAVDDSRTVAEDSGPTSFAVLANDTDIDAGALEITATSAADHGAVSVVQGTPDTVSYTPDHNYCGTDEFSYTITGGDTATVTITVTCTDDAPTAVDDTRTVSEDAGATSFNVLTNDTDIDAGPLEITGASAAGHGAVLVVEGSPDLISYTPDANYCGTDDFSYTITGGDTANVTITVTCVDDAPTAVDDTRTVSEDSGATTFNVLANDTDPDAGALEITGASAADHGAVLVVQGSPDLVSYTPDANYCGTDDFAYTVNGDDTANVTITVTCVDDAPTAVDDTRTVSEDSSATSFNVLANDTDIDAGPLEISGVSAVSHGTASVVQGTPDLVAYSPDANFCGGDQLSYAVTGGDTATVSVTVTCTDDAPVAVDDTRTVAEDSGATSFNVLANDSDIDAGPLEITDTTDPDHGTVTVTQGTPDTVAYTPDPNFCGADEFAYTVTGDDSATVTITVTCLDDAPTAVDDTRTVSEDSGATTFNVLANDSDIDAGALEITGASAADHGSVLVVQGSPDLVSYAPGANFCGTAEFSYTITGGDSATVTITITCIDDAPTAIDDTRTVAEDSGATSFNVLANDTDIDAGALEITGASAADHGTATVLQGTPDLVVLHPGRELLRHRRLRLHDHRRRQRHRHDHRHVRRRRADRRRRRPHGRRGLRRHIVQRPRQRHRHRRRSAGDHRHDRPRPRHRDGHAGHPRHRRLYARPQLLRHRRLRLRRHRRRQRHRHDHHHLRRRRADRHR